jgi:hypothetical protein
MNLRAEAYLQKAEEFEAMARSAQADAAKLAYEHLAWSYRQLGLHVNQALGEAADDLPERVVAAKKAQ